MKKKRNKYIHKVKNVIKDNIKIIIGIIIGITWTSGVAYAAVNGYLLNSDEVYYDNDASGLTSTNVKDALDELYVESNSYQAFESRVTALENKVYPVGSVYISTTKSTTSQVASLFGGTWCAISQGRVLIGAGTNGTYTFSAGSTGGTTTAGNTNTASQTITNPLGEYTHKLVVAELANHSHVNGYSANGLAGTATSTFGGVQLSTVFASGYSTNTSGSDYYHNNIQPYLVVYMYKRIEDNATC